MTNANRTNLTNVDGVNSDGFYDEHELNESFNACDLIL